MTVTGKKAGDITVAVAGSTGYIGKFVAVECVRRGYKTIALTRNPEATVEGAEMVVADVTDPASIEAALAGRKVCLYESLLYTKYAITLFKCALCWVAEPSRLKQTCVRPWCRAICIFQVRRDLKAGGP